MVDHGETADGCLVSIVTSKQVVKHRHRDREHATATAVTGVVSIYLRRHQPSTDRHRGVIVRVSATPTSGAGIVVTLHTPDPTPSRARVTRLVTTPTHGASGRDRAETHPSHTVVIPLRVMAVISSTGETREVPVLSHAP